MRVDNFNFSPKTLLFCLNLFFTLRRFWPQIEHFWTKFLRQDKDFLHYFDGP